MLERIYSYIRILSLDVVAGALFTSLAIARLMNVELSAPVVLALCSAVWVVYTFDHLIDARKISHTAHTPRHRFHQKYLGLLSIVVAGLSLTGIVLMFFIPNETLVAGLIVGMVTLVYFLALRLFKVRSAFQKELFIALVYVMGVFTGPMSLSIGNLTQYSTLLFAEFFLLAFANLVLFAWYERSSDEADGHSSLVLKIGSTRANALLRFIFLLCGIALGFGFVMTDAGSIARYFQWVISGMGLLLVILHVWPDPFIKNERYRAIGDGAFMLPGLILLV